MFLSFLAEVIANPGGGHAVFVGDIDVDENIFCVGK